MVSSFNEDAIGLEQEHICMLLDTVEDRKDLWLIYQLCEGKSMSELCFNVKGEFYKGERIYQVQHGSFYYALRQSTRILKDFIRKISRALQLLARLGVVHADLKTDNIVVDFDTQTQ